LNTTLKISNIESSVIVSGKNRGHDKEFKTDKKRLI